MIDEMLKGGLSLSLSLLIPLIEWKQQSSYAYRRISVDPVLRETLIQSTSYFPFLLRYWGRWVGVWKGLDGDTCELRWFALSSFPLCYSLSPSLSPQGFLHLPFPHWVYSTLVDLSNWPLLWMRKEKERQEKERLFMTRLLSFYNWDKHVRRLRRKGLRWLIFPWDFPLLLPPFLLPSSFPYLFQLWME